MVVCPLDICGINVALRLAVQRLISGSCVIFISVFDLKCHVQLFTVLSHG